MRKKRILISLGVLLLFSAVEMPLMSAEEKSRDLSVEALLEKFRELEDTSPALELDSNEDGQVDYLIKTEENGEKKMEVLDYDHDGKMDDFYMYERGVLAQRAIDSNYDQQIDIWVYLEEGVYILRYEKDTDFDGEMDIHKRYAPDKKEKKDTQ